MEIPRPISNSQLTEFKKSPQHWKFYIEQEKSPPTPAMIMGSLVHCLVLQKEKLLEDFYLINYDQKPVPDKDFRTKANREWKDGQIGNAGDKTIITSDDVAHAEKIVNALYENEASNNLIQLGEEFEKEINWKFAGINCLGKEDITSRDFIADLKVVSDASPNAFHRYIFKTGIYRQGGMYMDGEMKGEFIGDPFKRFYFIAVESSEPFGVSVHELDEEVISFGLNEYRMLVEQLKDACENDFFESYNHRSMNGTFDVFLPSWIATE